MTTSKAITTNPSGVVRPRFAGFARHAIAAAVCLTLAGLADLSHAQSSNATLRGAVTGPARAAAEVAATNTATGFTLRTRAGADGNYVLTGLPPGAYRVTVTGADGKKTDSDVTLQVGQVASVDLSSGGAAPAGQSLDRVVVSGAPVVDRKTSEVGTYVTPAQIQRLPQVTRNFLSFADLAPGVNVTYDAEGNVKIRSGATTRDSLNVFIDGVGQKDYVLRGGISGQENSRGNPFPQSALAEYKVITQNYKAEFDQVSSAAITAVTKSGTNEFHGDAFFDRTSSNWRAKTPGEQAAGLKSKTSQEQYGVSLGGPILKDRMHYFIAYEGKQNKDPQTVAAGGPVGAAALLPASARALLGPVTVPFQEDLLFAKIDWTPTEAHRLDLSVKYRTEQDRKHVGKTESQPFGADNTVDETRWDLKHQYSGERVTNEARVTYEKAFISQSPLNNEPSVNYNYLKSAASTDDGDTVLNVGGNNFYQRKGQSGYAFQNDLTLSGIELAGSHVIKIGGKIKKITVDTIEQSHPLPQYWYDIAPSGSLAQPYRLEYGAPLAGVGNGSVKAKNTQYGIYAQDDWEVNRQLTLNIGARYDYEHSPVYLDNVTPADIVAAINAPDPRAPGQSYAQTLARGGVDINQYISKGNSRKSFKNGFQPRLGASYDLFGDKQHVLFGGAGRSYDRNIFDVIQLERTKGTFPTYRLDFQGGNNGNCRVNQTTPTCVPWDARYLNPANLVPPASGGREIDLLNNNLKTPYSDQFSVGIRDAVGIWNTEVSISRIESKDGFTWLLGNRNPDGSFYSPGTNKGSPFGATPAGFNSLILGTNGLKSTTNSLFLKADKPYTRDSGWGVTLAYTFSSSKENHNLKDDFSYSLDYPQVPLIPMIRSTVVPRHKLVATGSFDAPYGILLSAKASYASPLAIRGTLEGCVDNIGCRDQVIEKNSFRQIDLSAFKAFDVGAGFRVSLRADVINVFNYMNYEDYNVTWGVGGAPSVRVPTGTLAGPPRTLKLGLGVNW